MSMIRDLEAARERVAELEKEVATLRAATVKPAAPAVQASKTPRWDEYNAIRDPGKKTVFWNQHEQELRAEQKAAGKGAR